MTYVQCKIDNIFRNIWSLTRAYIDDILCRIKSLPALLDKLQALFEIFLIYNISISPTKSYLNYLNVGLLGQRVNSLGLTTYKLKLKTIQLFNYPDTLKALEYYLGLKD